MLDDIYTNSDYSTALEAPLVDVIPEQISDVALQDNRLAGIGFDVTYDLVLRTTLKDLSGSFISGDGFARAMVDSASIEYTMTGPGCATGAEGYCDKVVAVSNEGNLLSRFHNSSFTGISVDGQNVEIHFAIKPFQGLGELASTHSNLELNVSAA